MVLWGDVFMKKIMVIPVIIVVLIGIILLYYSQQTGYVKLATPGITVGLRGLHGVFWKNLQIGPSTDPVKIHVGKYLATLGNLAKNANGSKWQVSFYGAQNVSSRITVAKEQATYLKFGPPLYLKTEVKPTGRQVSIGISITGQSGERYFQQVTKNGNGLDAPELMIVDEAGTVLASGKFEYG
jgi:hypothetical protein